MIKDLTNSRFAEIKAYAAEYHLKESINKAFARLENYSANYCEENLYSDFAPRSLYLKSPGVDSLSLTVNLLLPFRFCSTPARFWKGLT